MLPTRRIGKRARSYCGPVFCCLLVGLLAACFDRSTSNGPPSPETTPTPAPSSSATTATPAAGPSSPPESPSTPTEVGTVAIGVYRAMWADMVQAAKTADYQSPRLSDHASSQALMLLYGSLRKASEQNLVVRGEPTLAPKVMDVTPAEDPAAVSILDCVDDSRWLNYSQDGRLQNETPGGKHRTRATVGRLDDRWVVTRLEIGEVGSCT